MSLDVYLNAPKCPTCGRDGEYYSANITHNLGQMAEAAGIYKALWRPEEIDIDTAGELIPILRRGLADLESRPSYFEQYNAENGWGLYKHFVPFVRNYLAACEKNPESKVTVSR